MDRVEIRGIYWDEILYRDGRRDVAAGRNAFCLDGSKLLAGFLLGKGLGYDAGITKLAQGEGDSDWDNTSYVPTGEEEIADLNLLDSRVPDVMDWVDGSGTVTPMTPSRRLLVRVVYDFIDVLNGFTIRCQGILAGDSDQFLVNFISHPKIEKDATKKVTRSIILEFPPHS